ncbi:F-box/FBD/LRR-repeat protein At1g13570-like [Mercurialis annua]|uniref:F-box/FBD/LRR-repeat protein At1g13570-like n=1 Tax=Mercurialis annua TaxID=3986 RepID=UPI0021605539|nr:F-box/FBD/LRR-repeat protein At1g13570-like [Mercurialis annua]
MVSDYSSLILVLFAQIIIMWLESYDNDIQPAKKIENSSRSNIISNLPSNVIDNILICLPIQEAVRTSILSEKWRFKWMYLSKLVFDNTFYQTSVLPSTAQPNITKLLFNIYKVLLLHHGSILNFTLHVPLLEMYPEINQLMLYLSKKDVQEIFFNIGENKHHRLPSFLFSCVTLRRLTLSSCTFTVPLAFQGFVKLISLTFQSVNCINVFETCCTIFRMNRVYLSSRRDVTALKVYRSILQDTTALLRKL